MSTSSSLGRRAERPFLDPPICCPLPAGFAELNTHTHTTAHPIFLDKTDDLSFIALWKVMTFFGFRLLTTRIFLRRLSSVLSKFSHKFLFYFTWVSPLDGVTRGGPPTTTCLATPLKLTRKHTTHLFFGGGKYGSKGW